MAGHLEQPELGGAAEAVLERVQHAQRVPSVTVEREHGVDHVLEHPGPRKGAFFGDVADEHGGQLAFFRLLHEPVGAVAHLRDRSRRAGQIGIEDRLDRVERQHVGLHRFDVGDHVRQ